MIVANPLQGFPSDVGTFFRGTCADGKLFEAMLSPFEGRITYRSLGGDVIGTAAYTFGNGDCACSGETFSGDALCLSPLFETAPEGEVRFPFADGHRAAPCMCMD